MTKTKGKTFEVELSAYRNIPEEGGYCRLGVNPPEHLQTWNRGWFVIETEPGPEAGGCAIFAGEQIVAGRKTKDNIAVRWSGYVPPEYFPSLRKGMKMLWDQKAAQGKRRLTIYKMHPAQKAPLPLVEGMLQVQEAGGIGIIPGNRCTQEEFLSAAARLPWVDQPVTIAFPPPGECAVPGFNYYSADPATEDGTYESALPGIPHNPADMSAYGGAKTYLLSRDGWKLWNGNGEDDFYVDMEKYEAPQELSPSEEGDGRTAKKRKAKRENVRHGHASCGRISKRRNVSTGLRSAAAFALCVLLSAVILLTSAEVTSVAVILFAEGSNPALLLVGFLWGMFLGCCLSRG